MAEYTHEENNHDELCAQNIRYLRLLHDLPQRYMAHKLGISQVTYCRLERGEVRLSESLQVKLSGIFGCSAHFIQTADIRELLVTRIKKLNELDDLMND
jgi:transcriptional regulator with XRE-family HTH domain